MDKGDVAIEKSKDGAGTGDGAAMDSESRKETQRPQPLDLPRTVELRRNGYLALAMGLGSGTYDSPVLPGSLASQASGGLEFMGRQNFDHHLAAAAAVAAAATMGDDIRGFRQSSIDTEPQTLSLISFREAQDGAVEILDAYDQEEAVHLFLKDAEDDRLREEAISAILPTAELGIPMGWQQTFALDFATRIALSRRHSKT